MVFLRSRAVLICNCPVIPLDMSASADTYLGGVDNEQCLLATFSLLGFRNIEGFCFNRDVVGPESENARLAMARYAAAYDDRSKHLLVDICRVGLDAWRHTRRLMLFDMLQKALLRKGAGLVLVDVQEKGVDDGL